MGHGLDNEDATHNNVQAERREVEDPAWLRAIELSNMICLPMALKAAINLDVMDILNNNPTTMLSAAQIASHLPISCSHVQAAATLDRVLRFLASHGILASSLILLDETQSAARAYGLNDVSKFFVRQPELKEDEDGAASLAPLLVMNNDKVFLEGWHHLDEAVLHGVEPFTKAHGRDAFSLGKDDPRLGKLFNAAMASHTQLFIQSLLDNYSGFDHVSTLVDVGGGFGSCLRLIIAKHPHIRGINFDQPHVVAAAPQYPGVENVGGDMFASIPKADALFMKWILHDWNDEQCVKILKNGYKALPERGGKVIVVDALLPPNAVESGTRSRVSYQIDLIMLAHNQGGRERTQLELLELSKLAGFARMKVVSTLNEINVVELYKL